MEDIDRRMTAISGKPEDQERDLLLMQLVSYLEVMGPTVEEDAPAPAC